MERVLGCSMIPLHSLRAGDAHKNFSRVLVCDQADVVNWLKVSPSLESTECPPPVGFCHSEAFSLKMLLLSSPFVPLGSWSSVSPS